MSVRGGSGFREDLRFMASASAVGDGAGEARARPSAISIRIVPCVGRDEAWGVHRIRGGSSQLPEASCQIDSPFGGCCMPKDGCTPTPITSCFAVTPTTVATRRSWSCGAMRHRRAVWVSHLDGGAELRESSSSWKTPHRRVAADPGVASLLREHGFLDRPA